MLELSSLVAKDAPWKYLVVGPERGVDTLAQSWENNDASIVVRILRGRRCATRESLLQEWAAALQFPYYFGHNWAAFEDCLNDLEWLNGEGFVFVISNFNDVLASDEKWSDTFLRILEKAAREWSIESFERPEDAHPSIPFRIIFHCEPDREVECRQRLGAPLTVLTLEEFESSP